MEGEGQTNVGDVDLSASTSASGSGGIVAASEATGGPHGAAVASAAAHGCLVVESRLGFSVLWRRSPKIVSKRAASCVVGRALEGSPPYLSNVDEPAHEILVAERGDGVLSLLPRSIFHNSANGSC